MKGPEMTALDKTVLDSVKGEVIKLAAAFVVAAVAFQMVFYRESPVVVARAVAAFFWTFVLPGFAIMLHWKERLDFIERLVMGTVVGLAAVAAIGYNSGIMGLHLRYQWVAVPALLIAASFAILFLSRRKALKKVVLQE